MVFHSRFAFPYLFLTTCHSEGMAPRAVTEESRIGLLVSLEFIQYEHTIEMNKSH